MMDSSVERLMQDARLRGTQLRLEMIRRGEVIPVEAFLERSGRPRYKFAKDVCEHRIYTLDSGDVPYVPTFFLDSTLDQRRVRRVNRMLASCSEWECHHFWTLPKCSLARLTPLEALRAGRSADVMRAAAGFASR